MGTCVSRVYENLYAKGFAPDDDPHSYLVSRRIEKQLRRQEQEDRNMLKLLLLGSGNSGKSTVMKQFKIIHKRGFTADERRVFREALWRSAIESMRTLVRARQDYITSMHLDDANFDPAYADEAYLRDRALLDPSMEPYFQFLLFRVRNEQPLFEELIIPVAAESSPRADTLSPYKNDGKRKVAPGVVRGSTVSSSTSTLSLHAGNSGSHALDNVPHTDVAPIMEGRDGEEESGTSSETARTPILTSTTIVLSSPPPPERKPGKPRSPSDASLSSSDGLRADALHDISLGGPQDATEATNRQEVSHDHQEPTADGGVSSQIQDAPVPVTSSTDSSVISNMGNSGDNKKKKKSKQRDTSSPVDELPSLDSDSVKGKAECEQESRRNELGEGAIVDTAAFDEPAENNLESKDQTMDAWEQRADEQYEGRGDESGHRKKSKKGKKAKKHKRKQDFEDPDGRFQSQMEPQVKKQNVLSASSVESFRSEGSKNASGTKSSAPLVTWERMTIGRLLQKIWMDPLIQLMWAFEEKTPQLEVPLGYIMNSMDRMAEEDFQPTNEDILFTRKRTSGVNLLDFEAYGAKFMLIDVGGQRTERKKWLAHFNIVHAVIFVVGLDQYDQVMLEDGVTNRLHDSLELFEEMCASPWFRNSSFLLFLNKSDVFKNKIRDVPLTVCFRDYKGDPHDYDHCTKYIIKQFQMIHSRQVGLLRDSMPRKAQTHYRQRGRRQRVATPHMYHYITNATDTESMRFIIDTCQDILLRSEMAQFGFSDF